MTIAIDSPAPDEERLMPLFNREFRAAGDSFELLFPSWRQFALAVDSLVEIWKQGAEGKDLTMRHTVFDMARDHLMGEDA